MLTLMRVNVKIKRMIVLKKRDFYIFSAKGLYGCLFFLKGAQVGGRTWDVFDFGLFSLTSSALDHSATAPPYH